MRTFANIDEVVEAFKGRAQTRGSVNDEELGRRRAAEREIVSLAAEGRQDEADALTRQLVMANEGRGSTPTITVKPRRAI